MWVARRADPLTVNMSFTESTLVKHGPADTERPRPRRPVLALVLSSTLVIVGTVVILVGVGVAIARTEVSGAARSSRYRPG